jgi:hypothetical protein
LTSHRKLSTGARNMLSGAQKFALWKLLAESQAELLVGQPTYEQAAATMTERLGFTVTPANVVDAVNNGIVTWKVANRGPSMSGRKLSQQIADLTARVSVLEDIVVRLCGQAGVSPDDLAARPQDPGVSK